MTALAPTRSSGRLVRTLGAALVGSAVFVPTYVALAGGRLPGWTGAVLLALLIVATPVAETLSGRVALNGALVLGWVPILWYGHWPGDFLHGPVVLAAWAGALGGLVAVPSRVTAAALLPRLGPVDLLPVVAATAASTATLPWWTVRSPVQALEALLPGWDNAAHVAMFLTARSEGSVMGPGTMAPDGSRWAFATYPQGFHALVATMSEMISPHAATPQDLLASYPRAVSLVVVLGVGVLTSALVSLPGVRRRLELAVPAVVLVSAAYLWEPGQNLLADGFANFWLATAAAASALLLAVSSRPHRLVDSAAIAGLLATVCTSWTPLVAIAGPAALLMLLQRAPLDAHRLPAARVVALAAIWGVPSLVAARTALTLVGAVSVTDVVRAGGAIHGTSPVPTLVVAVLGPYVFLSYRGWLQQRDVDDPASLTTRRIRTLVLAPALGTAGLVAMLVAQMHRSGTTSYYFLKFLIGFELTMTAVTTGVLVMLLAAITRPSPVCRRRVVVGLAGTLLASQAFGSFPGPSPALWNGPGLVPVSHPYSRAGIARSLLAAAAATPARGGFDHDYVSLGPGGTPQLGLADEWFHALTLSASARELRRSAPLGVFAEPTVKGTLPAIRALLRHRPEVTVVVDPRYVASLREQLVAPGLVGRVVGWAPAEGEADISHEGAAEVVP